MDAIWLLLVGLPAALVVAYGVLDNVARIRAQKPLPEVRALVQVALASAARGGYPEVLSAHLLLAALYHGEVIEIVQASGADPAALRAALADRLRAAAPRRRRRRFQFATARVGVSPVVQTIVRRAVRGGGARGASPADVVEAILWRRHEGFAMELLCETGVAERFAAVRAQRPAPAPASAGRAASLYRRGPGAGEVPVVLWNDSTSTMEGVMRVLTECFGMDQDEALHHMLLVHHVGRATVAMRVADEAEHLAAQAMDCARRLGMSLRVTVGEPPA